MIPSVSFSFEKTFRSKSKIKKNMFLEYIFKLSETNTRTRCSIVQIAVKLRDKLSDVAP